MSESSSCLDLSDAMNKFSLSRTHFDMNKFGKPTEEDFQTVRHVVQKMVDAAHARKEPHSAPPPRKTLESSKSVMEMPNELQTSPSCNGMINAAFVSTASMNNGKSIVKVPKSGKEWSSAEDEMLLHVVQTMPVPKWKHVALHFDRSPYACEKRYERLRETRRHP